MATRKAVATDAAEVETDAPVTEAKTRKPRAPKAVTDLPTASAAFNRAKRVAERAEKALVAAQADAASARAALADSARQVKQYSDEISAAADAVLPVEVEVPEADAAPYEGDGYEDTAHTA